MAEYLVQEDGTSKLLLEDGSGALILERSGISLPFIGSATVVYAPSVPEATPSFIASATTFYTPVVALTNDISATVAGTWSWLCPAGVTRLHVEVYGGGGGTLGDLNNYGHGGGGGGAYASRLAIPVTPGTVYTLVVGAGGSASGSDGTASSFTGDSSVQVVAAGGSHGTTHDAGSGGTGGTVAASTGDAGLVFAGGDGGDGRNGPGNSGSGGGASGNPLATGASGSSSTTSGGAGANGGGSGGSGGPYNTAPGPGQNGGSPGGGGGGGGGQAAGGVGADGAVTITCGFVLPFIASNTSVYSPTMPIQAPFIGSTTVVYTPTLPTQIGVPFIGSTSVVYTPDLPEVRVPFIASTTHVWGIFSVFDPDKTYAGAGNGGEPFAIRLNANGVTDTATLAANISASASALELTGDGSLPSSEPFVAMIDSEIIYLIQLAPGSYRIRARGVSNTTPAAHTAGATVSWGDSYDMALRATANIDASFTANILSTGSTTYYGWLICFDSTQAYLSGSRYPMHVTEVLGVFDAGAGSGGSNRCDGSQPNAISVPPGTSDDCPAALSNPALITTDIAAGDVALIRYTNPEAAVLDLGPRSAALQSWFGLKRVNSTDGDVTLTDPNGYVVDTIPSGGGGPGPFTGSVEQAWPEPLPLATGIAPDASDAADTPISTPNPEPWTTVTLPGSDRYFTDGIHYSEKGWPICCLAVRQGNRRIPHWQSWDWKDYAYVYAGFGTDDTFAQLLINRNGIVFDSVPAVNLPGSQDIDGPDAVWDDATYYYAAAWYVVLFSAPYIVFGPGIGGSPSGGAVGGSNGYAPGVTFPPGGGGPVITPPPGIEGGGGGGILPPAVSLFQAAAV